MGMVNKMVKPINLFPPQSLRSQEAALSDSEDKDDMDITEGGGIVVFSHFYTAEPVRLGTPCNFTVLPVKNRGGKIPFFKEPAFFVHWSRRGYARRVRMEIILLNNLPTLNVFFFL